MKNKYTYIIYLLLLVLLTGCEKEEEEVGPSRNVVIQILGNKLSGLGATVSGYSVDANEKNKKHEFKVKLKDERVNQEYTVGRISTTRTLYVRISFDNLHTDGSVPYGSELAATILADGVKKEHFFLNQYSYAFDNTVHLISYVLPSEW